MGGIADGTNRDINAAAAKARNTKDRTDCDESNEMDGCQKEHHQQRHEEIQIHRLAVLCLSV